MAVVSGFITGGFAGGITNANLSAGLASFASEIDFWWPLGEHNIPSAFIAALVRNAPVTVAATVISAFKSNSYSDDFYHRVHITPAALDLGNIISTQQQDVLVWNAHLTPVQLAEIGGVDAGIELSGQPDPALMFTALQELEWQVGITPDGPAVLDSTLEWVFSNGDIAELPITGNRITAFTWVPDWANGIAERLTWATDVLRSPKNAEQRRALRLAPRRQLSADFILDDLELQAFDMALFGWGTRVWVIPFWPDMQLLAEEVESEATFIPCATEHLDFKNNGLAILRGGSFAEYETVEIDEVQELGLLLKRPIQNTWPARSRLYPALTANIESSPERQKLTDTGQFIPISFMLAESTEWPAVMPETTYQGYPVFDAVPDETSDITASFRHLTLMLDNGSALPRIFDTADKAIPVTLHRWVVGTLAERAELRSFFYALRGRQKAVWLPTHFNDLTIVATIADVSTTIDVAACGYTRFGQLKPGRRDIRIWLRDGTVFYRRITAALELSPTVERLVIDSALGQNVEPSDVMRISWMMLMRGENDSVEINYENDLVARSQQVFIGVRDDDL